MNITIQQFLSQLPVIMGVSPINLPYIFHSETEIQIGLDLPAFLWHYNEDTYFFFYDMDNRDSFIRGTLDQILEMLRSFND